MRAFASGLLVSGHANAKFRILLHDGDVQRRTKGNTQSTMNFRKGKISLYPSDQISSITYPHFHSLIVLTGHTLLPVLILPPRTPFDIRNMAATSSKGPVIVITGTPGTGKTTTAQLLAQESPVPLKHINVGDFVKENNLYEEYDEEWQSYLPDEDRVRCPAMFKDTRVE